MILYCEDKSKNDQISIMKQLMKTAFDIDIDSHNDAHIDIDHIEVYDEHKKHCCYHLGKKLYYLKSEVTYNTSFINLENNEINFTQTPFTYLCSDILAVVTKLNKTIFITNSSISYVSTSTNIDKSILNIINNTISSLNDEFHMNELNTSQYDFILNYYPKNTVKSITEMEYKNTNAYLIVLNDKTMKLFIKINDQYILDFTINKKSEKNEIFYNFPFVVKSLDTLEVLLTGNNKILINNEFTGAFDSQFLKLINSKIKSL